MPKLLLLLPFLMVMHNQLQAQNFSKQLSGPIVNSPGDSRSVNWIDINNDDWVDLMITNGPAGGQNNFLYINNGNGFTAVTNDTIVKDGKPSDGATWADVDNDGDYDCFVANWYNTLGLFYTNNGNGNFTYQSGAGLTNGITYSETASWGDYDNDGLLDLYVARSGGTVATNRNFLFHNDGNNSFSKVNSGAPVTDAYVSRSVNWTDADGDGDMDLFVSNEDVNNNNENFYRNDGGGNFTKLTSGALLNDGKKTMSSSWADFDNDGDMDVFLANENASNGLFRNDGNFNFTKLSGDTVSKGIANSFSAAWSDVDNDGDQDLFVTNSFVNNTKLPCFFYLNNGSAGFSRVSNHSLTADSAWTYGCAFGDYDNDGFEDLAVATCRFQGADVADFLYHNDGNSNGWMSIKLIGTTSNKSAIGAKIRLKATINGNAVWQMRELSAQSSYCGQNDMRAHFGLGNALLVDSIKVEWPSGLTEYYNSLSTNQFISITEGQGLSNTKQLSAEATFELFPNPAAHQLQIRHTNNHAAFVLLISNSKGDTIYRKEFPNAEQDLLLDLKKIGIINSGNYTVSIISKGKITSKQFIKL